MRVVDRLRIVRQIWLLDRLRVVDRLRVLDSMQIVGPYAYGYLRELLGSPETTVTIKSDGAENFPNVN